MYANASAFLDVTARCSSLVLCFLPLVRGFSALFVFLLVCCCIFTGLSNTFAETSPLFASDPDTLDLGVVRGFCRLQTEEYVRL